MLEPQQLAQQEQAKREALFIQRYKSLLGWALQLTNQHLQSAEDLVQDAFIQFALGRTSLEQIDNVDGYLRRMLRYMHIARITRAEHKAVDSAVSLSDYDSLDFGWSNIDPSRRVQAQQELWQICSYACSRKETSRAGAVLILRFFHNYLPAEIAQLLCASRHNVDQWQNLARRELKQFLNSDRGNLRLLNARKLSPIPGTVGSAESIESLQEIIFASRKGECLSHTQLQGIYLDGGEQITTPFVAHLVSCKACLDETNQILGLPLLAERHQSDSGRSTPPPPPSGGGSSSDEPPSDIQKRLEQRLRQVSEHKPKLLRVAVNGSFIGSTRINSDDSEFDLNLTDETVIDSVEVLSEQNIQLLFVALPSPAHPAGSVWARVELSDGRELAIRMDLGAQRAIHVRYFEPPLPEVSASRSQREKVRLLSLVRTNGSEVTRKTMWFSPLLRLFTNRSKNEGNPHLTSVSLASVEEVEQRAAARFTTAKPIWSRPGWLFATLALVLLMIAIVVRRSDEPAKLSARNILDRAASLESQLKPGQFTKHRIISYEERSSLGTVKRHHIEIWETQSQKVAVRVFDHDGRLVAGSWQNPEGKTVLHHGKLGAESHPISLNQLIESDEVWRIDLTVEQFLKLSSVTPARLQDRSASYVITVEANESSFNSKLVNATITLNRSDLRAVGLVFSVVRGSETVEYRFTEELFESVPNAKVDPSVFVPSEEISKASTRVSRAKESSNIPLAPATKIQPASTELEIEVAYLVAKIKGDRAEQLNVTRSSQDLLLVEGVAESRERKTEILSALAPYRDHPAVVLNIVSVDEISAGSITRGPLEAIPESEPTDETIAVDRELRQYLVRKNPTLQNGALDDAVRTLSTSVVNRSYALVFRAVELKRLYSRLDKVDRGTVSVETRNKWIQLLHQQAAELERESKTLRLAIQPILFANTDLKDRQSEADIAADISEVHMLAMQCNEMIRAAFTISSQPSTQVKSTSFLESLHKLELLSLRIKTYS